MEESVVKKSDAVEERATEKNDAEKGDAKEGVADKNNIKEGVAEKNNAEKKDVTKKEDVTEKDNISLSLCVFSDHFEVKRPSRSHHCFVYPVIGPKASLGLLHTPDDQRDRTLRDIRYQVVRTVSYLHKQGICHGGTFTTLS